MATKQHSTLTGSDLHVTKIDGTTGTELTTASETHYDARWLKQTGGTVTPAADNTSTLTVTNAANNATLVQVDTTNKRVLWSTQGGNIGDFWNIGGGGVIYNQVNATTRVRAGFSGKQWIYRDSANSKDTLTIDLDSGVVTAGGYAATITTKTGTYTATTSDSTVLADASGGTFQVTLPSASGTAGRIFAVKRTSASNNVTVGTGGGTIDGASTKTLGSQYATITVQSDGTNYQILSTLGTVT